MGFSLNVGGKLYYFFAACTSITNRAAWRSLKDSGCLLKPAKNVFMTFETGMHALSCVDLFTRLVTLCFITGVVRLGWLLLWKIAYGGAVASPMR